MVFNVNIFNIRLINRHITNQTSFISFIQSYPTRLINRHTFLTAEETIPRREETPWSHAICSYSYILPYYIQQTTILNTHTHTHMTLILAWRTGGKAQYGKQVCSTSFYIKSRVDHESLIDATEGKLPRGTQLLLLGCYIYLGDSYRKLKGVPEKGNALLNGITGDVGLREGERKWKRARERDHCVDYPTTIVFHGIRDRD